MGITPKKPLFIWTSNENWFIINKCGIALKWHEMLVAKLLIELLKSYYSLLVVFPAFDQSHSDNYGRQLPISLKLSIWTHAHVARSLINWESKQCSRNDYLWPCTFCYKLLLALNTWLQYANRMFFVYMYDCMYRYMWAHIRCTCMS